MYLKENCMMRQLAIRVVEIFPMLPFQLSLLTEDSG